MNINLAGKSLHVSFYNTAEVQLRKNFRRTEALLARIPELEKSMVEEMLELKNDTWLDEEETALSAADFKKKIKLETLMVSEDGSHQLFYADGDLFWGHTIVVNLDDQDAYEDATLFG